MPRKFGFSFSWKRALGISALKGKISRRIGIPLTRSGRQRKVGQMIGCLFPLMALLSLTLASCTSMGPANWKYKVVVTTNDGVTTYYAMGCNVYETYIQIYQGDYAYPVRISTGPYPLTSVKSITITPRSQVLQNTAPEQPK